MKKLIILFLLLINVQAYALNVDAVLKSTDRNDGLCVIVNAADPELAIDLARRSKFSIHIIHKDANTVDTLRNAIDKQGLYGRILVSIFNGSTLPYAENLINLIINLDTSSKISDYEFQRVLAPYGILYEDGKANPKPYPDSLDEWTHFRYDASGNMVSHDTVAAPPRHVRWVTSPAYQRSHALTPSPTTIVTAGGRLFTIEDDTPMGFAGLPDQWRLIARDAFNGKRLWSRDIKVWGDSAWSWFNGSHNARHNHPKHVTKRLVVSEEKVYVTLGINEPISVLDAKTGKTLHVYKRTENADEMVLYDDTLYISVNDRAQGPLPGKGFTSAPSTDNPSKKSILAIGTKSNESFWQAGPYTGITGWKDRLASMKSTMLAVSADGVFIAADSKSIIKIDRLSGKELFKVDGRVSKTIDAFFCHKDTLIISSRHTVTAFDGNTGEEKWSRKRTAPGVTMPAVFGIDDLVWVPDNYQMKAFAFDLQTGVLKKELSMKGIYEKAGHHPRCYPLKSTVKYMLSSERALETLNYTDGSHTLNHWARAACRVGHIPANGLIYKGPDPCLCHLKAKLAYNYALAGEDTTDYSKRPIDNKRLEKGSAYSKVKLTNAQASSEWPQFRHDIQRSGSVETSVASELKEIWNVKLPGTITAPVIAGGSVYVSAVDESKVYAFDERTGKERWSFLAGANVDSPPSIYNGLVVFGAADGHVYCLRAADGALVWRFRAAPYERNIMAFGRVESVWPVHGSVLIANGLVYVTAGRSSFVDGGIHLFVLDALTGKLIKQKNIHHQQVDNGSGERVDQRRMPDHAPGASSNILVSDGTRIFSRLTELDFGIEIKKGPNDYIFPAEEALLVPSTFADQMWFHKIFWSYGSKVRAVMMCFDPDGVYYCDQFEKTGTYQRKLFVPKGGDTSMIADHDRYKSEEIGIRHLGEIDGSGVLLAKENGWKKSEFPIAPLSMVATIEKLLIAGFELEIDQDDPWGKIEGRKGGLLRVLSKSNGKKQADLSLDALPVSNGMAAANEKVFISLKNGKLICLGAK